MFDAVINEVAEASPQIAEALPVVPGLVLHIDGDYLANFDGAVDIPVGDARNNAIARVKNFMGRIGAESAVMHNTAPGCHKGERYLIATVKAYQSSRTGKKPKNCDYLKDWLQNYEGPLFRTKNWATREADDGIGACSYHATQLPVGYAGIATADKDMRMLPGVHINWRNGIVTRVLPGEYDVIGEDMKQYGLKWFFLQMLQGDGADDIPGLPKYLDPKDKLKSVGEATALKLLAHASSAHSAGAAVLNLYSQGYGDKPIEYAMDRFAEQAALLWMRLDTHARIGDFAHHAGCSRINQAFDRHVWAAVERLETRVKIARQQIDELGSSYDPLAADCSTAG